MTKPKPIHPNVQARIDRREALAAAMKLWKTSPVGYANSSSNKKKD